MSIFLGKPQVYVIHDDIVMDVERDQCLLPPSESGVALPEQIYYAEETEAAAAAQQGQAPGAVRNYSLKAHLAT